MSRFMDKLLTYQKNKYVLTKAAMKAVDKIGNMKDYPEEDDHKTVINILNMILDDKVKYKVEPPEEKEEE